MAARSDAIITAGLRPELFAGRSALTRNKTLVVIALSILIIAGFGLRATGLSAEGLSEDELNKLNAVAEYRTKGLTGANGEHPMLMKALQAASIIAFEKWNNSSFVASRPQNRVAPETALRLPGAIAGALTAVLIFLIATELFGVEVALIAAALWAFDPAAIGLNRVAKEDTFLLFFFLLANVFWLRGQRVAEGTDRNPNKYYWATGAAYGAMVASKYVPHLLGISIAYYWMFQNLPETRWRLGKLRILKMLTVMGIVFLILSPTVLLPETWHEMGIFAGSKRISHDGYEFMNHVYPQRLDSWLKGVPVYFYLMFTIVKLPVLTVLSFLVGLPLLFRRKLGDGRYFLLFWFLLWVVAFCFPGGKFTRYYTTILPAVLITAALGVQFAGRYIANLFATFGWSNSLRPYLPAGLAVVVLVLALRSSLQAAPHFRLSLNSLGGGTQWAGYYFPHDEFYDASMREVIAQIGSQARPGAVVASESPSLASHYAQLIDRTDLVCISLSDPEAMKRMQASDFVIIARGRRYFSNDAIINALAKSTTPDFQFYLGEVPSVKVYKLTDTSIQALR